MPECPVPEQGDIIWYRNAPVPDRDDGCRNSNAGGIGLYADAQLWERTLHVLLISKYKKANLKLGDRQNISSENPWPKVDDKLVKLRPHSSFCYFIRELEKSNGEKGGCFDIRNKLTPAPLIVPYTTKEHPFIASFYRRALLTCPTVNAALRTWLSGPGRWFLGKLNFHIFIFLALISKLFLKMHII